MTDQKPPASPYKGLNAFSEGDGPFFFGRERERKIISANLRTRRLTLLYGPSGVGKTSVINAGVVYHLRQISENRRIGIQLTAVHARKDHVFNLMSEPDIAPVFSAAAPGLPCPIVVVVFRNWMGNALVSLQDAILESISETATDLTPQRSEELRSLTLTEMLKALSKDYDGAEILIILDQFEEYFVYHPTFEGKGRFADEFSRATVSQDVAANFLISIREDWLARLDRFKGRIPNLFENSIRIDHLERYAASEAIEQPILKFNELVRGEGNGRAEVIIEKGFVSAALNQLELLEEPGESDGEGVAVPSISQPPQRQIQPSRLQLVMEHLWDKVKNDFRPTFAASLLREPDTVKGIFQVHLNESLRGLTPREKTIAADLFRFLITPSNTKFATTVQALALRCNWWTSDEIRELLEKLTKHKASVLNRVAPSPGQRTDEPHYEITSDVLAGTILGWVETVQAEKRRKRAKVKRRRITAILTAIIVLVGVAGVVLVLFQQQRSRLAIAERRRTADEDWRKTRLLLGPIMKQDEQIPYSKAVLRGHTGRVTSAVFAPYGRVLTASTDGTAILWDIEKRDRIIDFNRYEREEKPLISASVSPDGNAVVTANTDGSVLLWILATGENTELRGRVGKHITDLSFSPAGDLIVGANTSGDLIVWNTASGERVKEIAGNGRAITRLAFSPSGNLLAVASQDHTARVWRRAEWDRLEQSPPQGSTPPGPSVLTGHTDALNSIAFSPECL